MNTGQSLLSIGAMMLLSILVLRVNNTFTNTSTVLQDSKLGILATSIATSQIEEISRLAFDECTDSNSTNSLSSLTPPASLGPEPGETYPNYNDVDDYNGFTKTDTSMTAVFNISCSVVYVSDTNPDVASSVPTWNKKITITVTSPSLIDTIRASTIYSYWYFR